MDEIAGMDGKTWRWVNKASGLIALKIAVTD
jgi:hypothetical protein